MGNNNNNNNNNDDDASVMYDGGSRVVMDGTSISGGV